MICHALILEWASFFVDYVIDILRNLNSMLHEVFTSSITNSFLKFIRDKEISKLFFVV